MPLKKIKKINQRFWYQVVSFIQVNFVHTRVCALTNTHIYIYIYIEREKLITTIQVEGKIIEVNTIAFRFYRTIIKTIVNITPHGPDDGSVEPKRYSVDLNDLSFNLDRCIQFFYIFRITILYLLFIYIYIYIYICSFNPKYTSRDICIQ